jgi:hypothetical protein
VGVAQALHPHRPGARRRQVAGVLEARFAAQLLAEESARDTVGVCDRLLAVQAQDLRSARLAVRARTRGLTVADFDSALTDERTVVIGWLNRGTLHLVRREDYWWLHALTTPRLFAGNARRLAQVGVTAGAADRGVAAIAGALAEEGPLTRNQLRDRVQAAGVPTGGQALIHLLMLACLRGVAVRGPLVGGKHAYVLARDWLGDPPSFDRASALRELARRYLGGHAPADERDLAKWAGLPLRDARAGLRDVAQPVRAETGTPRTCLLDQWDPLLVGWRSRTALLEHYPRRDSAEAHYRPFAYAGARAVATWSFRDGVVAIGEPFRRLTRSAREALEVDGADVRRFLLGTEARSKP